MTDTHATLRVEPTAATSAIVDLKARRRGLHYVILTASNGEPLLYGETHPNREAAEESAEAILRAFIEVLEDEGYTVTQTGEAIDPLSTFEDPGGDPR